MKVKMEKTFGTKKKMCTQVTGDKCSDLRVVPCHLVPPTTCCSDFNAAPIISWTWDFPVLCNYQEFVPLFFFLASFNCIKGFHG
jgi:hypothetical protein